MRQRPVQNGKIYRFCGRGIACPGGREAANKLLINKLAKVRQILLSRGKNCAGQIEKILRFTLERIFSEVCRAREAPENDQKKRDGDVAVALGGFVQIDC